MSYNTSRNTYWSEKELIEALESRIQRMKQIAETATKTGGLVIAVAAMAVLADLASNSWEPTGLTLIALIALIQASAASIVGCIIRKIYDQMLFWVLLDIVVVIMIFILVSNYH